MKIKELQGAMEAILFASGDPINIDKLAQVLQIDKPTAKKIIKNLADKYNSEYSGIHIIRLENGYQMCTDSKYAEYVRAMLEIRRNTPLSPAAMEVLSVIAYNQPVTKAFMEQVRGVDCSGVLSGLLLKDLVEERGRLELPGRPLLYGTTDGFLRCLNISSISELPPLEKEPENVQPSEESEIHYRQPE